MMDAEVQWSPNNLLSLSILEVEHILNTSFAKYVAFGLSTKMLHVIE